MLHVMRTCVFLNIAGRKTQQDRLCTDRELTCKIMKRIMRGFWVKFSLTCRSARSAHWVVSHYDRFLNDSIAQSVGNIWFLAPLIHDDWPHRGRYCITDEWFFMVAVRQKIHSRSAIRSHRHKNAALFSADKIVESLQPVIAMVI